MLDLFCTPPRGILGGLWPARAGLAGAAADLPALPRSGARAALGRGLLRRWSSGCSRGASEIALDDRVDRALGRQRAFEQGEMVDREGRAGQAARLLEQIADRPRAALQPGERDVRQEGALVGRDADPGEGGVDLLVKRLQRLVRGDAGPDRVRPGRAARTRRCRSGRFRTARGGSRPARRGCRRRGGGRPRR